MRRERRAAARAERATSESTENLEESATESVENTKEADCTEKSSCAEKAVCAEEVSKVTALKKGRSCSKCGAPSKGHPGPCGQKCSAVLSSPEKECCPSLAGDTSLTLTQGQGSRAEPCSPCGELEFITETDTNKG